MDWKIELLAVPVESIDRAKAFYLGLGFSDDHDIVVSEHLRFVQLTPPGSACSIVLDDGLGGERRGPIQGIQVVVESADTALEQLTAAGIGSSGIVEEPWGRFVYFSDPDGNGWAVQELGRAG